ncbi:hypothetical protein EJB05_25714, partial [Eragrostis curvula]
MGVISQNRSNNHPLRAWLDSPTPGVFLHTSQTSSSLTLLLQGASEQPQPRGPCRRIEHRIMSALASAETINNL